MIDILRRLWFSISTLLLTVAVLVLAVSTPLVWIATGGYSHFRLLARWAKYNDSLLGDPL